MMRKSTIGCSIFVLLISSPVALPAYDRETHRAIAERSVDPSVSSLDRFLRDDLGLEAGIRERFPGRSEPGLRTVQQLVGAGASFEDVPSQRVLNHFHNPLAEPWWTAGLLGIGQSSVLWQQNPAQDNAAGGGNWSWQDARRYFLDTLRGETRAQRERTLVETFEALGHLTHLIQDAAVPAHVRDDPHPSFIIFGRRIPINPDWYEDWVDDIRESDPVLFGELLNQPPVAPPVSVFTPTDDPQAPVPVARLIDTDRFRSALANIDVTAEPAIGIAESTNGNYLSRDTLFRRFPFPRQQALGALPVIEPEGAEFRRYFSKTTEGEPIRLFVTEGALHRSLTAALGAPPPAGGWFLDERVHQEYAARLLPRAVGYSAALLDYFFRGRLDVDLFAFADPEGVDPAVVQVRGINVSDEALGAGTLRLYADDPAGVRTPLPPASPTADLTVTAAPGQPVVSAPFRMTADAERVVAVYQGRLGEEKPDPAGTFPGAVIGKVLGGVRVEELFAEPDTEEKGPGRWMLRTPKGVYPLRGFTTAQYERVTWGEGQDVVLAWTPFTPEQAVFRTFAIPRQPGSIEPLLTETPAGREVVLRPLQEARFPFGRKVGPTVAFSDSLDYAQRFGRFEVTSVWVEKVIPPDEYRRCVYERTDLGTVTLEPAHTQPITFSGSFPLLLDVAHNVEIGRAHV